jgi:prolipoprotein diacylglyceryltransferase
MAATQQQFDMALQANQLFYAKQFGSLNAVHHINFPAILHLPKWLFAYNYPHNVINEGVNIAGCSGQYCSQLPIAVFPTPFYETIVCLGLFAVLWVMRKRFAMAGQLSGLYLILNGIERFTIEKIRVNTKYEDLPFQPTQAEIISFLLIIAGIVLFWLAKKGKFNIPLNK